MQALFSAAVMTFRTGIEALFKFSAILYRVPAAAVVHLRQMAHLAALSILLAAAPIGVAQTSGGVTFSGMSGPPSNVTIAAGATYTAVVSGTVAAATSLNEVTIVELREGSTVLASAYYPEDIDPKTDQPKNNPRPINLQANLSAGSHSLYLYAETYNGPSGTSVTYPVNVTVQAPPAVNGATFAGQSTIPTTMQLGQSYPVSITFTNSGTKTWTASGANPYSLGSQSPDNNNYFSAARVSVGSDVPPGGQRTFSFNVTPTQTGTFTFQMGMLQEYIEWFGGSSPAVTVTVPAQPPVPSFSQPTSDTSVVAIGTTATVSFAGTATPASGASISTLELREAGVAFASGSSSVSGDKSLAVGTHTIELKATDSRGTTASVYRTVTVISSPPTPSFTLPASNITVNAVGTSYSASFTGSATPGSGASMSSLQLREGGVAFASGVSTVSGSKTLGVGSHSIELLATDSRGNTASAFRTVTVNPAVPSASISSPANNASFNVTSGTTVSVPVTASATPGSGASISSLRLYVDGTLNQTVSTSSLNTSVTLAEGTRTLAVEATDNYGSIGARNSISVSVLGATPISTLSTPSGNTTTAAPSGGTAAVAVSGSATAVGGSSITALDLLDNGTVIQSAGATTTFSATVNLAPGTHNLQLRATNAIGKQGLSQTVTVTVLTATPGVNAAFVSQSIPASMRAGQPYTVTVQMLNTGTTTWTPSGGFRLGTQNPSDNHNFNMTGRGYLSASVATGQVATFTIPVTAPATAGTYNMQWKMVQEFVTWFGELTPNQAISVAAGAGPTATVSASPTNVRVSGSLTAAISFAASSAASAGRTLSKLELFQGTDVTDYSSSASPVASTTLSSASATWAPSVNVPAGVYFFKVRSTDSSGVATDSKSVIVNVTNSSLIGSTEAVRTNASGNPELLGWTCQIGNAAALNYKVYLDAPSFAAGATVLASGTANVSTEPDSADVQTTCSTPGASHNFVVDLSPYVAQYAGRALYVWAETADHSQTVTLPCADNKCTMPGTQRVALTTPQTGDTISSPNPVFLRMQLTNYSGTYDELGFYVNGQWVAAQSDGTPGAYSASLSGLSVSATPYTVYAKVRQGNTTLLSLQRQFTVVAGTTIALTSPSNGASLTVGTAQTLSATVGGGATIGAVRFFANGVQISTGTNSSGVWNSSWTPTSASSYSLLARAYDASGNQLAESPAITVAASNSASSSTPIPVALNVPHLTDPEAGTLPGELAVTQSGAASYTIPIVVPPGTAGVQPALALTYDSSGTNGLLGLGWKLGGMSLIHRCGKTIAQDGVNARISFTNSDRLCLDGQRLVLVNKALSDTEYWAANAEYRTEIDSFTRITALGDISARTFKAESKDGRIMSFGAGSAASAAIVTSYNSGYTPPAPATRQGAQSWALDSIRDRSGNIVTFEYTQDGITGEHKPSFIRYGGNALKAHGAVEFVYESRPDAWKRYIDETRNDLRNRISKIRTYVGNDVSTTVGGSGTFLVREYSLAYEQSPTSGRSLLTSVGVCARNVSSPTMECQPATVFSWGKPDKAAGFAEWGTWSGGPLLTKNSSTRAESHPEYFAFADFENHGRTDVLEKRVAPASRAPGSEKPVTTVDGLSIGTKLSQYRYFHNNGAGFTEYKYKLDSGLPFVVLDIADFNGDGAPDIVAATDSGTKACLSPLGAGAPGSTINPLVFTCSNSYLISGASNSDDRPAYLVDVLGDGRSGQYSRIESTGIAKLCLQATCYDDDHPPSVLTPSYANDGTPEYALANYVGFTQMVDFSGIGKPYDVRFSLPQYTEFTYDDAGLTKVYINRWQNLRPTISITGFNLPIPLGQPAPSNVPGAMASYSYPTQYASPPPKVAQPPYVFDKPYPGAALSADFSGSGYSSLAFGFLELGYDGTGVINNRTDMTVCLSTGRGLDCGVRQKYSGNNYKAMVNIADFVGDGAPAILAQTVTLDGQKHMTKTGQLEMCRVTGDDTTNGTGTADNNMSCEVWPGASLNMGGSNNPVDNVQFMDLLGTGRMQLVYYHGGYIGTDGLWHEDGRWTVYQPIDRAPAGQALDRIYSVANGVGTVSSVEYVDGLVSSSPVVKRTGDTDLAGTYPQHLALRTGKIVKTLRIGNGGSRQRTKSYAYADPGTDVSGRGALGFGTVTETDLDTSIVTTTRYSHTWPFNDMARSVQKVVGGVVIEDTVNTLSVKNLAHGVGPATVFPYVSQSTTVRKDPGDYPLGTVTTVNRYEDEFGNLTSQDVTSTGGNKTFQTLSVSSYKNDTTNWLIGLPEFQTVTKIDPDFVNPDDSTHAVTRHAHNIYDPTTGLLSNTITEEGTQQLQVQTDFIRTGNTFGLVNETKQTWYDTQAVITKSRSQTLVYDTRGRYPESSTNAVGQSESSGFDPSNGVRISLQDANLLSTTWTLNGFGRVAVERRADNNETRSYVKRCVGACRNGAALVQIVEHFNGNSRTSVPTLVYSDDVGHTLSTQTFDFAGSAVYADQSYDPLGRLERQDQPTYEGVPAKMATRLEYEVLSRVNKRVTLDEGGSEQSTTTTYQGLTRLIIDPLNRRRTEVRDVLGQLVSVTDPLNGVTTLSYEPFGNLGKATDPSGNVSEITYDRLGHKLKLKDPDLGLITYVPDQFGRVLVQQTAEQTKRGDRTDITYDMLDRMTARLERDLKGAWIYDTALKGKGQLAEAYTYTSSPASKDYRRVYTYDSLGRPSTVTTMLSDAAYTSTPGYDTWGRLISQTHQRGSDAPKAFGLRYNTFGYLGTVERGSLVLWRATAQDAAGRVTAAAFGNGLTQTRTYSPTSARLTGAQLVASGNLIRLDESYQYDAIGNVKVRNQQWSGHGFIELFDYDELNRLKASTIGADTKAINYYLDGRIKNKTGVGSGDYAYPTPGQSSIHPHAVTNIPGIGDFHYDGNGNLLDGAARLATWTSFDMPMTITKGSVTSTFRYGPEYQRVRQDRGDGSSIIYAGVQEVETTGGQVRVKTYWPQGVGLEIDELGQATKLRWTHADRLGSPVALTDEAGGMTEELAFDPWGKRRDTVSNATPDSLDGKVDNKGFTHHEMLDQLDLVHMNGRVYDPLVGRFMSGDPLVQDPSNGQNFNRYSYVLNNPTNFTDPTGFACADPPTGSHIPVACANGDDDKVVNYSDGSRQLLSGNGKGRTFAKEAKLNEAGTANGDAKLGAGKSTTSAISGSGFTSDFKAAFRGEEGVMAHLPGQESWGTKLGGYANFAVEAPSFIPIIGGLYDYGRAALHGDGGGMLFAVGSLGADLVTGGTAGAALRAEAKAAALGAVGELRAAGLKDAHHIIQDAAVRDLPGYRTNSAPGMVLQGPANLVGTEHYIATSIQRAAGGGTYAAERRIGYEALRRAGVSEAEARAAIMRADAYFQSIGVRADTVTRIPGNR